MWVSLKSFNCTLLDEINGWFGRDSLICAAGDFDRRWAMMCGNESPVHNASRAYLLLVF